MKHDAEKIRLENELKQLKYQLDNVEYSYRDKLGYLKEIEGALASLSEKIPSQRLKSVYENLKRGDSSEADKVFAEIELEEAASVARAAEAAYQRGHIARDAIRWQEAREHFDKAHRLEPEDEIYLYWAAHLAYLTGDYLTAEPLYRRALALAEKNHGGESREYATAVKDLAGLLEARGDLVAAEPLRRHAIQIGEKALGSDHPDLAIDLNNIAELLRTKGDLAAAEPLFRRAIEMGEKTLGPDHPHLAGYLNNLAELLYVKGDFSAAEPLYRRAIEIGEKNLESDHLDSGDDFEDFFVLDEVEAKGNSLGNENFYRQAITVGEKMFKASNSSILIIMYNFAELLALKGESDVARALLLRAIAISEKTLGPDHPKTKDFKANYAAFKSAHP